MGIEIGGLGMQPAGLKMRLFRNIITPYLMIKSYLLIGFRSLRKHFSYSVINILGLGLGLATCLLLVMWIRHELSYDRFHRDGERLYRATLAFSFGGQADVMGVTPNKLLAELRRQHAGIESGVRVYEQSTFRPFVVQHGEAIFQEGRFSYADSTFFQVFSFNLLQGNVDKALAEPNSVVITEAMARKYFGTEDPLGKILKVNNKADYIVTGVIADVPSNSTLQFDFMASFHSVAYGRDEPQWFPANFLTYIKVRERADLAGITALINQQMKTELASELTGAGDYIRVSFLPMADVHLAEGGHKVYVYIFSAIAILILVIACINYVNLSTARAADRAKEVGIRKVAGALRTQLFAQFIGESVLVTFLAFVTALLLAGGMLPVFNSITGKSFSPAAFLNPVFLAVSIFMLTVIGILSGAYPALAISAFKPASILKGSFKFSGKGIWLRRTLVVTQFTISIALMISTLVIYKQLRYISSKQLGYNKENTIILPLDRQTEAVFDQLRTELITSGRVTAVSRASEVPTEIEAGYGLVVEGTQAPDRMVTAITVDTAFIPTFGMSLKMGRNFTETDFRKVKADTTNRSSAFIVNETALKALAIDANKAIGTRLRLSGRSGEIIGVVNDFHFASLRKPIEPIVLFDEVEQFNYFFVRLDGRDTKVALEAVKNICHEIIPHRPFEYRFVDQQYAALYDAEERMASVFIGFASLAIIIAGLGLLGLVSFSAAQKTKEIGIRKVLGATPASIVMLVTKDFSKLIVVAIALALPLAYYIMSQWLSDFAYKTEIGVAPLLLAPVICIGIAFLSSAYQALRAAWIDPADTLRSE